MARVQAVKSTASAAAASSSSSMKKFAASMQGERLAVPNKIVYRHAKVGYGTILAAVTEDGRPCAIVLNPEGGEREDDDDDVACLVQDVRKRFPSHAILSSAAAEGTSSAARVHDTLESLVTFVEAQQRGDASYAADALALQARSLLYGSAFQQSVWRAMASVPLGQTCTYAELARRAGHEAKASRAVAQACGTNPLTFLLPCHRITASGGAMGGYHWGVGTKEDILRDERRAALRHSGPRSMKLVRV